MAADAPPLCLYKTTLTQQRHWNTHTHTEQNNCWSTLTTHHHPNGHVPPHQQQQHRKCGVATTKELCEMLRKRTCSKNKTNVTTSAATYSGV